MKFKGDDEANVQEKNYFDTLYAIDFGDRVKQKNGLNYLPWGVAWAAVKHNHPDARYTVFENEQGRFWFDDGKTGWVKVAITIDDIVHVERLAIMNHRNQPIAAEEIKSTEAINSMQRALTKACGRHGVGLYVYEGEEIPEDTKKKNNELKTEINKVITLSKELTDKLSVPRENILEVIADMNDGNKNPNSIATIEACSEIIAVLKKMKAEAKKKKGDK